MMGALMRVTAMAAAALTKTAATSMRPLPGGGTDALGLRIGGRWHEEAPAAQQLVKRKRAKELGQRTTLQDEKRPYAA